MSPISYWSIHCSAQHCIFTVDLIYNQSAPKNVSHIGKAILIAINRLHIYNTFFCRFFQFVGQLIVQLGIGTDLGDYSELSTTKRCIGNNHWNCYQLWNRPPQLWVFEACRRDCQWLEKGHWNFINVYVP